ncbi:hypothetical protein ACIB24_00725 [Spongisporangium articulatum]|uniref:Uncharacterized protein n=1 Tax=Spongisporangium articulatum TaxID=3362603 RepID=A0ABW8AGV2_9ACTN
MTTHWRLNPPPNWPVPADAELALDWRPDPAWGPPPVGWQLWKRRRHLPLPRLPHLPSLGAAVTTGLLATAMLGAAAYGAEPSQHRADPTTQISPVDVSRPAHR